MLVVSACLAGEKCRYDGKDNKCEKVKMLVEKGEAIPVCPEVMGGLSTPRIPCEQYQKDGKIYIKNKKGEDVTGAFLEGAKKTLEIAKAVGATKALLKAKSPSCGKGKIYDGTFSGCLIEGNGITTQLLEANGIEVKVI